MLILLAALGMGMMVSAGDLISLYVGIELQSLALYVLAAFRRDDAKASEAGLKYFVLGALSSGLLLYGASLIYGFAGSTRFADIAAATHARRRHRRAVRPGVPDLRPRPSRSRAAPFHMWTPDVYEGAPTPIVGFFAAAPKLAAMVLFARAARPRPSPGAADQWRQVVLIVGAASRCCGRRLRRPGAEQPQAAAGPIPRSPTSATPWSGSAAGDRPGVQSMLIFMVLYMIDVTGFFACLAALTRDGKPMETVRRHRRPDARAARPGAGA